MFRAIFGALALAFLGVAAAGAQESPCIDSRVDPLSLGYFEFRDAVIEYSPSSIFYLPQRRSADCEKVVLQWMAMYRARNQQRLEPIELYMLLEVEGRRRAMLGDYASGIELYGAAQRVASGWRSGSMSDATVAYFDAQIAFLKRDKAALMSARNRLLAIPPPADWEQRQAVDRRVGVFTTWPMGIGDVNALIECFEKPYRATIERRCLGRRKQGTPLPYYK